MITIRPVDPQCSAIRSLAAAVAELDAWVNRLIRRVSAIVLIKYALATLMLFALVVGTVGVIFIASSAAAEQWQILFYQSWLSILGPLVLLLVVVGAWIYMVLGMTPIRIVKQQAIARVVSSIVAVTYASVGVKILWEL